MFARQVASPTLLPPHPILEDFKWHSHIKVKITICILKKLWYVVLREDLSYPKGVDIDLNESDRQ